MLAAATSWAGLADELSSAAAGFSSITSQLAGSAWQGPASAAMAAAAGPYAGWLGAAASQATGAAAQANVVAALHDTARAVMVHPLAVAANRSQLVALVRSNLFGFAAPAIAATECVNLATLHPRVAS
jgi:PPE-repeat protein